MSLEIFQARDDWGQTQRVVALTTSTAVTTYTAKTGRAADDFVIDRVIRVTTTDGNNMLITAPNGVYYGQRLLIIFEVEGNAETVDVNNAAAGAIATQRDAAGEFSELAWLGSTLGWIELNVN